MKDYINLVLLQALTETFLETKDLSEKKLIVQQILINYNELSEPRKEELKELKKASEEFLEYTALLYDVCLN